ncbi:MAG TPA: restriction endonuclease subunit S, partial [Fervidobacterium sp.]|nr:restriction endonuclease subunit S [Fervidobacterium sp.]
RSKDVKRSSKYLFDCEAVIVPGEGKDFVPRYYKGKFDLHQRAYAVIPNEQVCDGRYCYYALLDGRSYFSLVAVGSTVMSLRLSTFESFDILLPPLPEQRAIASVLSSLDDKIDLLHRENKTLEAMAETLFRQWFIEEAKDEWEEKSLKDIYIFEKGFEPGSENYLETEEEDAIRFIRVGDMLSHTPSVYIKKSLAKSICSADDLLMSFDGTPGRLNFGIEGAYSSGIRRIYSLNPVYDNLGLKYLIFKSKHIQDTVNAHSSGTVILHASSSIDELTFSFPDERKLEEFNEMITPIFSKMQLNKRQFRILEKLRDTLLPKLMSGEVRVKYVEEEMASCRA